MSALLDLPSLTLKNNVVRSVTLLISHQPILVLPEQILTVLLLFYHALSLFAFNSPLFFLFFFSFLLITLPLSSFILVGGRVSFDVYG